MMLQQVGGSRHGAGASGINPSFPLVFLILLLQVVLLSDGQQPSTRPGCGAFLLCSCAKVFHLKKCSPLVS